MVIPRDNEILVRVVEDFRKQRMGMPLSCASSMATF